MNAGARKRLGIVIIVVAVTVAVVLLAALAPWSTSDGSYNVVLISLDTTRRDHMSMYGYERDTSPRLRAMAERGVVFERAIAVHTNTAPSHASMLTGLYPASHGIRRNGYRLDDQVTTLGEILGDEGYVTGAFVSGWTLTDHTGLNRGFETYDQEMPGAGRRKAELTLRPALPWLRERAEAGEKFFMFFHLFDPHYPYDPPEGYGERFLPDGATAFTTQANPRPPGPRASWPVPEPQLAEQVSRYDGEIAYADHQLGLLFDHMEELGIADDTVFVFVSDHGDTLYERPWIFDHGGRAYDEQIRVPMFVRLPGDRFAGTRVESQVSHVDIVPTVLAALGIGSELTFAGRSLFPVMEDETEEDLRRPVFAHARPEPRRVPEIDAPLVPDGLIAVIRLPKVKLIEYPMHEGWYRQLFDLEHDPGETRNVAEQRREIVDRLHVQLDEFRGTTGSDDVTPPAALDPEVEEALRALGYVQ